MRCAARDLPLRLQLFWPVQISKRLLSLTTMVRMTRIPSTIALIRWLAIRCARPLFLIGSFARRRPEIVRAIRQGGHLLGNPRLLNLSIFVRWERRSRVREELVASYSRHRGRDRRSSSHGLAAFMAAGQACCTSRRNLA